MTIQDAQVKVDNWIKTYGVRYFSELTNLAILMEEMGEFSRLMARKYGDQSFKNRESENEIPEELADILWVVLCLANQMEINLEEELEKSFKKKTQRDHQRHKNNRKLGSENE